MSKIDGKVAVYYPKWKVDLNKMPDCLSVSPVKVHSVYGCFRFLFERSVRVNIYRQSWHTSSACSLQSSGKIFGSLNEK